MESMYVSRCHINAGWEDGDGGEVPWGLPNGSGLGDSSLGLGQGNGSGDGLWDEYGFQDGNGKGLGLGNY